MRKSLLAALLAVSGFVSVAVHGQNILIVHAGGCPPTAELTSRGFTVTEFEALEGTPTLAQLAGYDAVLAYTNYSPSDPVALGNVLADYVDGGGKLALGTYAFTPPWSITGRIATTGYMPFVYISSTTPDGAFVAVVPDHPVFAGIDTAALGYFLNYNFANASVDTGATLLATDGSNQNLVAINGAGNIYGLNLFPANCTGSNNAEFYDFIANVMNELISPTPTGSTLALSFSIYNQGRARAWASGVRAYVSDKATQSELGGPEDVELTLSGPDCGSPGCVPELDPGQQAAYTATILVPSGGFTTTMYVWIIADSEGGPAGQAGQTLTALRTNDAQRVTITND